MLITRLEFCEPCASLLTIYREREGAVGLLRALGMVFDECPVCSKQAEQQTMLLSEEEPNN